MQTARPYVGIFFVIIFFVFDCPEIFLIVVIFFVDALTVPASRSHAEAPRLTKHYKDFFGLARKQAADATRCGLRFSGITDLKNMLQILWD